MQVDTDIITNFVLISASCYTVISSMLMCAGWCRLWPLLELWQLLLVRSSMLLKLPSDGECGRCFRLILHTEVSVRHTAGLIMTVTLWLQTQGDNSTELYLVKSKVQDFQGCMCSHMDHHHVHGSNSYSVYIGCLVQGSTGEFSSITYKKKVLQRCWVNG